MPTAGQEQIDAFLKDLSREELLTLLEHIVRRLRQVEERTPQSLYGVWKEKFPEEVDIDEALGEIRQQWAEEFEESNRSE